MGRVTHVCATCAEHFTRRYSARRHNLTVHNGRGEIVPLLEYLVGKSSGRYHASHPSWYRGSENRVHKFGHATVADYAGDTFRPAGLQQGQYQPQQESLERYRWQQQQALSHSIPPPAAPAIQDVSPYPTDRTFQSQSMSTRDDEETTTLSRETILKIEELKRLIYRYSQYHHNPSAVVNCIIYYCNNGDNTLLDEKLEQLRNIDSRLTGQRIF
jgi:hypothetical protein